GGFGVRSQTELYGDEDGVAGAGGGGGGGWYYGGYANTYGRPGGNGGVYVRWVSGATAEPDVEFVSAAPSVSDETGIDVVYTVRSLASGGDAEVSLRYGLSADSLAGSVELAAAQGAGTFSATVPGFVPGTTYYVAVEAGNASGTGRSSVLAVTIPVADAKLDPDALPGLLQSSIGAVPDFTDDYWSYGYNEDRVAGVIVHDVKGAEFTNSWNGAVFRWYKRSTGHMWAYRGYIWLEEGKPYVFASRFFDSVYLKIGDSLLLFTTNDANHSLFGDYVPAETGWFPIDARLGNYLWDDQAHGPDGDGVNSWNTMGLGFNDSGSKAMMPQSAWTPLLDPGDGSLLRVARPAGRTVWVASTAASGGALAVTPKVGSGDKAAHVYLVYGAKDSGTADLNDLTAAAELAAMGWTAVDLGTVAAADAATTLAAASVPDWTDENRVARLVAISDGATSWTDPVAAAADELPSLSGVAVTDVSAGDIAVAGGVVAGGTAPYTVEFWVGDSAATLARASTTNLAAAGAFSIAAEGLTPGATYSWKVVLVDAEGGAVESGVSTFTLPAQSQVDTGWRQVYADQRTLTFRGRLSTLGAGTTWAVLCIGRVPGSDFVTDERHPLEVDETGLFEITLTRDWDEEFAYTWACSNSNGRQTWTQNYNSRSYNWVQVQDDQDYVWKGGEGSWTDPAMWITDGSKSHDESGYPRRGSTIRLADGAAPGTINVPDDGTFFAKTVVVTNGQELTLHRDTTNWVRFAYSHTIANRGYSDGSLKAGKNGTLKLSGGTWYVDAREGTGSILSDGHGSSTLPGATVEVLDGADLRIRSRDTSNWVNFNADFGYFHVGAGSRLWADANFYAGAPGLVVRVEGTIETSPTVYTWETSDRRQIAMDSLRSDQSLRTPVADWEIGGSSPRLVAGLHISADSGGGDNYSGRAMSPVKLMVPVGGFDAPVFSQQPTSVAKAGTFGGTGDGSGKQGSNNKFYLVVPTNAPAALAKAVTDTAIVYWPTNAGTGRTVNRVRAIIDDANLAHPDTDYWYETFDSVTGDFTGFGVHIVGRPASEAPQVVGLEMTNLVSGAAALSFYGIPGDHASSATFSAAIERTDDSTDTSATVALVGGPAVSQGTLLGLAVSGLADGGTYRVTVTGVDPADGTLTCTETLVFDALRDYGEASTVSAGATTAQLGAETVWTFADDGELVVTRAGTARILLVGGGGSGGTPDNTGSQSAEGRRGGGGG
ncbi:MAG: hypothetical protein II839_08430, partial [Kiritimatiellae bacterium]|nr:hypothetical protein [Kiritimatiellia bacterium]